MISGEVALRASRRKYGALLLVAIGFVAIGILQLAVAHERALGEPLGRPRVKLTSVAELLRVGHG